MKVLHSWLQDHITDPLPSPEQVSALLTAHVCEVDAVETVGTDTLYDVKVLPDRAHYLLSHVGIARELALLLEGGEESRDLALPDATLPFSRTVTIAAPERCRRYQALEVHNVHLADTPALIKTRLEAVGQRSINPLVDMGNYAMFDVGQPIHIFDANKVVGNLTVRLAASGETIELLTGEVVTLSGEDLVVADEVGPLAIAGVKGGKRAEGTTDTTHLIIEAANFTPSGIRRTATRLRLRNDSSKRFENEITPALTEAGLALVASLVRELAGTAVYSAVLDTYPVPAHPWEVVATATEIEAILGLPIDTEEIVSVMERLGASVRVADGAVCVTPPLYRLDLMITEDIADEIARIRGYADLPSVLPPALPESNQPDRAFYYAELAKDTLASRGYSEALLYTLTKKGAFEIVYPLASDKAALRENLSDHLEKVLIGNTRNADFLALDVVRICEVGKVFPANGERLALALGVLPIKKQKGVSAADLVSADLAALEAALGVPLPVTRREGAFGATAEVDLEAVLVQLPPPPALSTLNLARLPEMVRYQKISPYPFIVRDVAVFVPADIAPETVRDIIAREAGELCVKSWLFDTFTKEVAGVRQTSYAFRLIFQSDSRTLEESEVEVIMTRVYAALARKTGWQVR